MFPSFVDTHLGKLALGQVGASAWRHLCQEGVQ